jgi:hypothetical protein
MQTMKAAVCPWPWLGAQVVMTKFKDMYYNETDQTMLISAGNNHADVYSEVAKHGRVTVGGQFKTVRTVYPIAQRMHLH